MNCECCGKIVETRDNFALHTACMRNHANHLVGERSSRCKSGVKRTTVPYERLPEDWQGLSLLEMASDFDTWYAEAKRVRTEGGITRAGILGTSCPTCYRQVRYNLHLDYDETKWCSCEITADWADENRAHGIPEQMKRVYRKDSTFTPV